MAGGGDLVGVGDLGMDGNLDRGGDLSFSSSVSFLFYEMVVVCGHTVVVMVMSLTTTS